MTEHREGEAQPVAWRYVINYGPEGEENYANVYDAHGELVANLRTHHARAIVAGMNDMTALATERQKREAAEQREAKANARIAELEATLTDAIECVESWSGYASDYFKEKHDLAGDIARLRQVLSEIGGGK